MDALDGCNYYVQIELKYMQVRRLWVQITERASGTAISDDAELLLNA